MKELYYTVEMTQQEILAAIDVHNKFAAEAHKATTDHETRALELQKMISTSTVSTVGGVCR